jgi:hypothetical protein
MRLSVGVGLPENRNDFHFIQLARLHSTLWVNVCRQSQFHPDRPVVKHGGREVALGNTRVIAPERGDALVFSQWQTPERGKKPMYQNLKILLMFLVSLFPLYDVCAQDQNYPDLYLEMNLPLYPGADVVSTGRNNSSLADGITVVLEATASHAELRRFYESVLIDQGWELQETVASARMRQAGMLDKMPFIALFCHPDGTGYKIMSSDLGARQRIQISLTGDSVACDTSS